MIDRETEVRRTFTWVMSAIGIWGFLLALGAFLFGYDPQQDKIALDPNPARGLIVLTCVAIFLGGWLLLLRRRASKTTPPSDNDDE